MFTALFARARTVGWVAQWNEMISDPEQEIGRPRQLYTGPTQRDMCPWGIGNRHPRESGGPFTPKLKKKRTGIPACAGMTRMVRQGMR